MTVTSDMRTFIKERCDLALTYAEDGAYKSAATVLRDLAGIVTRHAEGVHQARPLPPGLCDIEPEPGVFKDIGFCFYRKLGVRVVEKGDFFITGPTRTNPFVCRALHGFGKIEREIVVPVYHAVETLEGGSGPSYVRGKNVVVPLMPDV